jgi:cell division septation protein DedD
MPAAAPAAPASGGSTIQLGAFSSEAKASAAWKNLSGRFSFLAGLTQSILPVQSGDKTLYRLRATGGNAGDICSRLRTAGESCSVVG